MNHPELTVMLTHNDRTVLNAEDIFRECVNSKAKFWGFKEEPLPPDRMKDLFRLMRECGKTTFLEVVAYTEAECLEGAKLAVYCGCDILMGTIFTDSINDYCKKHKLKYMPFVGRVTGRPSVLEGTLEDMVSEAKLYLSKGVYGIDLLGYRYTGYAAALNRQFVSEMKKLGAPVCLAGSINSFERLTEVRDAGPWTFTIGSAFFENRFGASFSEQIDKVCEFMSS